MGRVLRSLDEQFGVIGGRRMIDSRQSVIEGMVDDLEYFVASQLEVHRKTRVEQAVYGEYELNVVHQDVL